MKLRFGDVTFDGGRRALFRGPKAVPLSPKAFKLLELLLSRRPDAVSKAEILESVWSQTHVSEGSLTNLVKDLRKAIGESSSEGAWIRTVFGFGYAFEGTACVVPEGEPASQRHFLVWDKQEIKLTDGANVIGRERTVTIWISHPSVSREHARIVVTGDRAGIEDLGSKNGTWRGRTKVSSRQPLFDGDDVRVGEVRLTYRGPATSMPSKTRTAD
jgi:DNA-binding winged helix-turn-helix (wHTH) protein